MPGRVTSYVYFARQMGFQASWIGGAISVTIIACLLAWAFPVWPGDRAVLAAVQSWQSPWLNTVFETVTYLGWYPVAAAVSLLALVGLLWRRRGADALLLTAAVSSALLTHGLKALVGRPRPDFAIVESAPQNMGFPSGHAAFAILLAGVLIYLAWQHVENPRARWGLCAALALLVLAVGISRVYLGVHWPSDVLGGYLFGATALPLLVVLKDSLERRLSRRPGQNSTFPGVGI